MSDGVNENAVAPDSFLAVLAFRGRIGKLKYFLGLIGVIAALLLAFVILASAMDPRGRGGGEILILPLLFIALYIHFAVAIARLRDAGRSAWLSLLFVFGPMVWLFIGIELTSASDGFWIVVIAVLLGLYAVPGLMRRPDAAATA